GCPACKFRAEWVPHIDDPLHDVPDAVYDLLELVGEHVPTPIDVVLERDGVFPRFEQLLAQIDRARVALARGRARAGARTVSHPRRETQTDTTRTKRLAEPHSA